MMQMYIAGRRGGSAAAAEFAINAFPESMVLCTVVTSKLRKLKPWAIMRAVHVGAIYFNYQNP
jgi:hypothetical protein